MDSHPNGKFETVCEPCRLVTTLRCVIILKLIIIWYHLVESCFVTSPRSSFSLSLFFLFPQFCLTDGAHNCIHLTSLMRLCFKKFVGIAGLPRFPHVEQLLAKSHHSTISLPFLHIFLSIAAFCIGSHHNDSQDNLTKQCLILLIWLIRLQSDQFHTRSNPQHAQQLHHRCL